MKRFLLAILLLAALPAYAQKIQNQQLANMTDGTIKGRAIGAGTGSPTDLTQGTGGGLDCDLLDGAHASAFALLAGRAGGQTLNGGTAASDDLTLDSTANATKGKVLINPSGGNVGIGTTSPGVPLAIHAADSTTFTGSSVSGARLRVVNTDSTNNSWSALNMSTVDGASAVQAGAIVSGIFKTHTAGSVDADMAFQTAAASVLAEVGRFMSTGHFRTPELSAPGTPASGFAYWYANSSGQPRFKNDSGTDYDLSFSSGAYDPEQYWGRNIIANFPPLTGQDTAQPEWWEEEDANVNVTDEDAIGESIPDKLNKRVLKVVGGASGANKYVYQRETIADHDVLDTSNVVSCSIWVYQPDAATAKLELVGSVAGSLGSATTTAVTTWTILKVENKTIGGSDTYFDIRFSTDQNSDTSFWTNPQCNIGPVVWPFSANPVVVVYARTNAVVSRDPANTNWNTASYASATHPLTFMIGGGMNCQASAAASAGCYLRPTFTSASQDTSTAVTRSPAINVSGLSRFEEFCNDSQQMDDSAGTANVTTLETSVTHYWRFQN